MDADTHEPAEHLYLRMAESMASAIRSGTLTRGERMPSVRSLARQYGVSLATAVQAYRTLEDARLVEARPRSGYFVAARTPSLPEPVAPPLPATALPVDVSSLSEQVMRAAHDPAFVSLGAACPSAELFDQERIRRAFGRAVQRHRASLCQYEVGPGHESYRRAVSRYAMRFGCQLDPRAIIATGSCLDAISLALRAATQPGDIVALESPTYFGFLEILEHLHLRALEIPCHPRTGLSLDALQLALDTQPVRAVLAVPTLSNPLGVCMPAAERRQLARMVAAHDIPLIEDVLCNDLVEHDDKRRSVKSFDTTGHVMICGSFSKTVAPGIRLGWIEAGRWSSHVRRLKLATAGGQTPLLELAMADLLTQPGSGIQARRLQNALGARIDEARSLIAQSFPRGTRVTDPPGGTILWVELPPTVDSTVLFQACLAERIVIGPGTMFSATGRYRHNIRLSIVSRWDDAHRQGLLRVGRIATTLHEQAVGQARRDREAPDARDGPPRAPAPISGNA